MIVPALAAILFTACNTEPKGPTQAELDTQVDAKVQTATDQLKADCDMRIMQAAQMEADSILAKGGTTVVTKPATTKTRTTTTKTTTTTPPVKKTEEQQVKDRFKTDPKKEEQQVKDRFKSNKTPAEKAKDEEKQVKDRFSK